MDRPASAPSDAGVASPPPEGGVANARGWRAVARPAIVYSVLFGAQGACLPYISIFLASTGLDLGTVGALIALFAAVNLVAAPAWGAVADALGDVRAPVLVAALLSSVAIGILAIATSPLGLAVGIVALGSVWAGIIPMIDSRTVVLVGARDRFGLARAPGSGAFVIVAFATGALIGVTGPRGMFLVYGPLVALVGVSAWLLLALPRGAAPGARTRPRPRVAALAGRALAGLSPATLGGVLRTPRLGPIFIAAVLIWTSHGAYQGFISLRITQLGGDATVVAATWSLGALLEVFLMSAFPIFARRFGIERLIAVGAIAFALRALIAAVVDVPLVIVLSSLLGGIGFTFVYIGIVTWVAGTVDRRVQATAQGIFTGTANGIGSIGGAILGGVVGGGLGLTALFGVAAVGYLLGAATVWLEGRRSMTASRERVAEG